MKITKLFLYILLCLPLVSQSQSYSVYKHTIDEGVVNNYSFDADLYLDNGKLSSPHFISKQYKQDGSGLELSTITYPSSINIANMSDVDGNPKELMMMHHLNDARKFAVNLMGEEFPFGSSVITVVNERKEFYPTIQAGNSSEGLMIELSIPSNSSASYNPLATDAYAITRAYFMLIYGSFVGEQIQNEGVNLAVGTYFAHRYMTQPQPEPNFINNSGDQVHIYGGHGTNPQAYTSLEFNVFNVDFSYGEIGDLDTDHKKSELLFATLWELGNRLNVNGAGGHALVDQLLVNTFSELDENNDPFNIISQAEVASILYESNLSLLTPDQQCIMIELFFLVYGSDFINYIDEVNLPDVDKDYIIRDSYNGQYSSAQEEIQGEDIGNEANNITTDFSRSPDIWNRLGSDFKNNKEHQNPIYDDGAPNYLYVEVRAKDCEIPSADEKVHVYIRESHLSSMWPKDWTAGYYVEDDDTTPLIGYEITHSDNNSELPTGVDGIPMSDYVYFYTEEYTDPETGTVNLWKVFRYEIPWVPFNPLELPEHTEEGAKAHVCLLARVVASDDPMTNEQVNFSAWQNNVNNNNIAIRNTSIIHLSGEPEVAGGVITALNIKSPYIPTGGPGNTGGPTGTGPDTELDIEISIHPNDDYTDEGDPIIPSTTGPGDPVIFDYIDIEIFLTDDFLTEWISSGLQGSGFTWVDANTIKVTSTSFSIKDIKLPPRKDHRIFVKTTSKQDYTAIDFTLLLKDYTNSVIGSQTYNTRGSLWIDRSETRNDGSRSASKSTIEVHPNPALNYVTVTSKTDEISRIELYNVSNERMNVSFDAVDAYTTRVDITDLNSGIYFMRVQNAENIETIKFVKMQ